MLELAAAAAALKHSSRGDALAADVDDVEQLLAGAHLDLRR